MARIAAALAASAPLIASAKPLFSSYIGNWVQYHANGYAFDPADMAPIIPSLDIVTYAFFYFCPPPGTNPMPYWSQPPYGTCDDSSAFQILSVDPHDAQYMQTLVGFKSVNPKLKVIMSVGGWNFPSAYFSAMAATNETRSAFITSVGAALTQYGADGVDIDWEYPCSPARSDPVEITCTDFQTVPDAGGRCPEDSANIVTLFTELRAALGRDVTITVATQAARAKEALMHISQLWPLVDMMNIMTYDYSVSDVPSPGAMAPNAPLYMPPPPAPAMSANDSVFAYRAAGVPAAKIGLGLPLYGHTWFNANLAAGNAWAKFGAPSVVQGACCGPFATTGGGAPGRGAQQCGTYMISEIAAAAPDKTFYDNATQSAIAYFTSVGADGYTQPGVWITYNDERSSVAFADYAAEHRLGAIFVFDASMDTMSNGQFTFGTMNAIAGALAKYD